MEHAICEAIRGLAVLEFQYKNKRRVVKPYCHGYNKKGEEILRAIQVEGASSSGGFGYGKLWAIGEIHGLRTTGQTFVPDDPNYNPADSAMAEIHCCVAR
jgi:hypothetical protein